MHIVDCHIERLVRFVHKGERWKWGRYSHDRLLDSIGGLREPLLQHPRGPVQGWEVLIALLLEEHPCVVPLYIRSRCWLQLVFQWCRTIRLGVWSHDWI